MLPNTTATQHTKPIRIVIADDNEFFIDGFCAAMARHCGVFMAGQAGNGLQLMKLVEELRPDVVFTEVYLPQKDGISATKEIVERFPYIHVIGFSNFMEDRLIADMMEAGAMGYLLKNEPSCIILKAIDKVMKREVYYSHEVSNRVAAMVKRTAYNPMKPFEGPHFSELEMEVMREICEELSCKEIAAKLEVDVRTVESAKSRIMEKTGCRNSAGIVKYAIKNYIVKL